jgi:hypothetical protein
VTPDVLEWLNATLAAVEREADDFHDTTICNAHAPVYYHQGDCDCPVPAAVRASVEADRAILAALAVADHYDCGAAVPRDCCCMHRSRDEPCSCGLDDHRDRMDRLLASRYAHRPGWDEAWKP